MFQNSHNVNCWQKKECKKTDCPAYEKTEIRCWYRAGTYCGGPAQGTFVDKAKGCRECEVFKESCPTLVEEVGEALNNLLFSLREEKKITLKQHGRITYLNKELISSLENLDSRNREIQELVITDKLTGLYNRNYMITVLEDEIIRFQRKNDPLTVLMIDLDDFKLINDTCGHAYGDKVLSSFGKMLKRIMRKSDRAFRYGGEEFLAILQDTDLSMAWILAERIRTTFESEGFAAEERNVIQKTISTTLSIGMATYKEGMTVTELLQKADEAVYKAKAEGKNTIYRDVE